MRTRSAGMVRPMPAVVLCALVAALSVAIGCAGPDAASSAADRDTDAAAPLGSQPAVGGEPRLQDSAVAVRAQRCRPVPEHGVGLIIESGRVLTAAHVVAGATTISVGSGGREVPGEVIAFDPIQDLAVLAVPEDLGPPIALAAARNGSLDAVMGEIAVFRDGEVEVRDATIVRRVAINTEDIYRSGRHRRIGYEVDATIDVGDSGSVVVVDGEAVAVIWGRARRDPSRVWAADAVRAGSLIAEQLDSGVIDPAIDLGRCS